MADDSNELDQLPPSIRKLLALLKSEDPARDAFFEVLEHVAKSAAFLAQVVYAVPDQLETFHDVASERCKEIMHEAIEKHGRYNVTLVTMSELAREMIHAVEEKAKTMAHEDIKKAMKL